MKANRNLVLGLVAASCLALAWWLLSRPSAPAPGPVARPAAAAPSRGARRPPGAADLPEIGLARVLERGQTALAGKRDIFAFGPPPTQAPPPPTQAPPPTVVAVATLPPAPPVPSGPPPPPPLNVKFIGSVEDKRQGLKVAVLLTDRQEILTGKAGEVVANRLRIVSIGLESIDVQDVGASGVRRIPLKGN